MNKSVQEECRDLEISLKLQVATLPEIPVLYAIDSVLKGILMRKIGELEKTLKGLKDGLRRA
ncbi:MAG: hypothetical protein A3C88_02815 [Candidatus Yanofskybacteria bacterium RIFCSPHIGHO2_02_FULL_50_12]|uniref:Uncharacterized protein n=1 Tax=Candidatus Yanofskybacteria bacterium RIFCSPHIGHO2_02_FULL_50_12 TaxID=1802685 RepID=A0A1F8FVD4_9BACT|nr:MAG: hypothetical protein A3C88_02815 [Candidatus Yanofskybacteria bacterium RIFCSPHIGHO2_02_FULL_50_12]